MNEAFNARQVECSSNRTQLMRKQANELRELFLRFLEEHPDIDLDEDDDLTPVQQIEWEEASAAVLEFHKHELPSTDTSEVY